MRIWLDDLREAPEGWVHVKTARDAIALLDKYRDEPMVVSLDHDLGDEKAKTGYDVVKWIEEQVLCHDMIMPLAFVHSQNSVGRIKMEKVIARLNNC